MFVTAEFGGTSEINNEREGRDHYALAMLMARGGVKPGQMIGETDEKGTSSRGQGILAR